MTEAQLKRLEVETEARSDLLFGMRCALSQRSEYHGNADPQLKEMKRLYDSIAKRFGFEPGHYSV